MNLPTPQDISDIGGWAFAVIVCAVVIAGFVRGDLVPGWIHKRETERADKTTDLIEQQTAALAKQTGVIAALSTQIETLVSLLRPAVRGRGE